MSIFDCNRNAMGLARSVFGSKLHRAQTLLHFLRVPPIGCAAVRFASAKSGGGEDKKSPARMPEVHRFLYEAEERCKAAGGSVQLEPVPKITLDHIAVSYGRSGGSGGKPGSKAVNSKIDMRFNVKNATWLSEKVRERIMQMEKHRINKDGEIVISSTKTRALKTDVEEAAVKLRSFNCQKKKFQEIINAASYVPRPLSEETVNKIANLSAMAEQKRLEKKTQKAL